MFWNELHIEELRNRLKYIGSIDIFDNPLILILVYLVKKFFQMI